MLHPAQYGAQLFSELAIAARKLSMGLLMESAEVARRVPFSHRDACSVRWWLCGGVHPAMFAAAQERSLRHLGKVIVTPEGTRYLVLAQQVGAWQHRVLLQVAGRQVHDFLAASLNAGFDLSLGLNGGDESLLVQDCRFVRSLLGEVEVAAPAPGQNMSAHQLRQEACMLAATLLLPEEVTAEELPAPQHVCVTIVASRELVSAVVKQDAHTR